MKMIKDNTMENAWIVEISDKPTGVHIEHDKRQRSECGVRIQREFHNLTAAREYVESFTSDLDDSEIEKLHRISIYQIAYQWKPTQEEGK